jgi:hypothetical protein
VRKLTIQVDIDLNDPFDAGDVIDGIIDVLKPLRDQCYQGLSEELKGKSGVVLQQHNTEPDSLVGHWELTA